MAYELYIYPPDGTAPTLTAQTIVAAFNAAGLPCVEEPDKYGHWLVIEGIESSLNLTTKDSFVTGAGFRFVGRDDPMIIQKVADVFKGMGWCVSDDEGDL